MEDNKENSKDKRLKNLELGKWKKGESGNPKGKAKGQRDYATIYREALIKLAEKNNKTPEELEDEILSVGLLNARKGNYAFYKDVIDRTHGTALQKVETKNELKINLSDEEKEALKRLIK